MFRTIVLCISIMLLILTAGLVLDIRARANPTPPPTCDDETPKMGTELCIDTYVECTNYNIFDCNSSIGVWWVAERPAGCKSNQNTYCGFEVIGCYQEIGCLWNGTDCVKDYSVQGPIVQSTKKVEKPCP